MPGVSGKFFSNYFELENGDENIFPKLELWGKCLELLQKIVELH